MKVRLKRGWSKTYAELTVGNVYRVLGIEADDLRIISDTGDPILFCAKAFDFVDATQPSTWIVERGGEGEVYAYPPELRDPRCFFEKFHDGDVEVRRKLFVYVHQLCHREREHEPDPPNIYLRVDWRHDRVDDPITIYSELDEERWEVRKVEMFRDGRITYAWGKGSTGSTRLGDAPVPLLDDFVSSELSADTIDRATFDVAWDKALDSDDP